MSATAATPSIQAEVDSLGPWFHNLHLPDGTQTAPEHRLGDFPSFKWQQIAPHVPMNLAGWRCLDIGCNAGFYSLELAKRGGDVLGIDVDEHYFRQARWAAERHALPGSVRFRQMQVYDLAREGEQFDLVLFMGVLYHLRYPLLGLDLVCQRVRRLMIFQTLTTPGEDVKHDTHGLDFGDREQFNAPGWPRMAFIEHHFANDPTNWWAPNHAAVEAMLRSSGMRVLGRPAHEIYLCEPDPARPSCVATWNAAELRAATGQSPPSGR